MTPKQGAKWIRNYRKRLGFELEAEEAKTGKAGVEIAQRWSSGTASRILLRRLGSPYGLGERTYVAAEPALINHQTTNGPSFFSSWTWKPDRRGGVFLLQIINTAPYAHFLDEGTVKMIRRPIREAILRELRPIRARNLRAAMRRARGI